MVILGKGEGSNGRGTPVVGGSDCHPTLLVKVLFDPILLTLLISVALNSADFRSLGETSTHPPLTSYSHHSVQQL